MAKATLLAAVLAASLAGGAGAQEAQKSQKKVDQQAQQKGQQKAEQNEAPGAAAVVLVPMVVVSGPQYGDGCWARLYDGEKYAGDALTVLGPAELPNLRTASGRDWSGSFDSAQIGPNATVTAYDNENFEQRVSTFKPGQRIADLDETRGFFEDIRSLKISCSGGAKR